MSIAGGLAIEGKMMVSRTVLCLALLLSGPACAETLLSAVAEEQMGRRLIAETPSLIGPDVADPAQRYAGNNLACQNCHLDAGTRSHGLSLVGVTAKYPRPSPLTGAPVTLADRINHCMTRSMNGRPLPEDGPEMRAMIAWMRLLTRDPGSFDDPAELPIPMAELDRPADPVRGRTLYEAECAACHKSDGAGMRVGQKGDAEGYLHPPLWGADSFNDGAGMAGLIVMANFIHDNMPPIDNPAAPSLGVEEAWDIAAYVESQPRPALKGLDQDYAGNVLLKPVDAAYPPYVEGITPEQYRFGPFQPIRDRIAALKAQ